jgi:peptidoglycan hydrolase-like protein with peptidoglycan-binding domain
MAYLEANREGTEGTDWPAILQVGSRHRKVRILNGMLYSLGYLPKAGIPHRTFDAATETAVRDFQEDRHLDPDGIVGPITRTKLYRQLRRTRKEA